MLCAAAAQSGMLHAITDTDILGFSALGTKAADIVTLTPAAHRGTQTDIECSLPALSQR